MSLLPGAEFAPILTRTIIDLGPEGSDVPLGRAIRWRADVTDPDDQRAIWRLAALALGATTAQASDSVLILEHAPRIGLTRWVLATIHHAADGLVSHRVWWGNAYRRMDGADLATAALCAHVWGPKPPAHQATP